MGARALRNDRFGTDPPSKRQNQKESAYGRAGQHHAISRHHHQGMSADAIVSQIPGITLPDVHAALGYYYGNLDAIRDEMCTELAAENGYRADIRTHVLR